MEFLRFLRSVPSRFLAILLGMIVLPLFSIMYLLNALLLSTFLAVAVIFAGPFFVSSAFEQLKVPRVFNAFITVLISTPTIIVLSVIALSVFAVYLIIRAAFNFFANIYTGLSNGLLKGLDGFFQALNDLKSPFELLNLQVSTLNNRVNSERAEGIRLNDFQRIIGELEDVKVPEIVHEIPDLESKEVHAGGPLLNNVEREVTQSLILNFLNFDTPLDYQIKAQMELLKKKFNHYNDLLSRLNKVAEQIRDNRIAEIDDQIISFNEVETPIFLFKQYFEKEQWHSIPAQGYVTNKESLFKWLAINPIHPLTKDNIKEPSTYDEKPTRYQWYKLTNQYCTAQELVEHAIEIRKQVESLSHQIEKATKLKGNLSASSLTFYVQPILSREGTNYNNESTLAALPYSQ